MGNPAIKIRKSDGLTTGWGGDDLHVETNSRFVEEVRCDKKLDCRAELNVAGIQTHANASGAYVNGRNTVVKSAEFTASSKKILSGAVYVPANSIITRLSVIVTEALVYDTATVGCKFGTAAEGDQFGSLDPDSLKGSNTTVAVGVGNSTDNAFNTQLGGAAQLGGGLTAAASRTTALTEVHGTVIAHTGDGFTDGTVSFIVEFIYCGGNA